VKSIVILSALVAVVAIGVCTSHGSLDGATSGPCGLRDPGACTGTRLHDAAAMLMSDVARILGVTPTWLAEDDAEPDASGDEEKTEEEEVPGVDRTWNIVLYG